MSTLPLSQQYLQKQQDWQQKYGQPIDPPPPMMASPAMPTATPILPQRSPSIVMGPNRGQEMYSNGQSIPMGSLPGQKIERQRMIAAGPGEEQLYHKIADSGFGQRHPILGKILGGTAAGLTGAADIGFDTLGGGFGQLAAEQIPGSILNHQVELNHTNRQITAEEGENKSEADTADAQARTNGQNLSNENEPQRVADAHAQSAATTANFNSEAAARDAAAKEGPSLAAGYSHAVNQAIAAGRDPSQDPIVQHLADAITSIQKQPIPKTPTMGAITLKLPNGQQVAGKKDSQGNLLLADNSPAPKGTLIYQQPNYGELVLPTKTQTVMVNNVPTVMGWDENTRKFDVPMGTSASGAAGHAMFQAGAIQRDGEMLINDIQANRQKLGTLAAWIGKYGLNTPIGDPDLAELSSELQSFAALNPAMHGFRGSDALSTFENIIGDLQKNPDATISSIRGILKTANALTPGQNQSGQSNIQKSFSLRQAMSLPFNKGKSEAEVRSDLEKHGYTVVQ